MAKYAFSAIERYAVWLAHGRRCFWCMEPIEFRHTTIDHVIPESLQEESAELKRIRSDYSLGTDFELNDYVNWVPAHGNCNSRKQHELFAPSPALIAILSGIRKKADEARRIELRVLKSTQRDKILGQLDSALETGEVSTLDLSEIVALAKLPPGTSVPCPAGWNVVDVDTTLGEAVVSDGQRSGIVPTSAVDKSKYFCPTCGNYGPWNGARCMICGRMDCD